MITTWRGRTPWTRYKYHNTKDKNTEIIQEIGKRAKWSEMYIHHKYYTNISTLRQDLVGNGNDGQFLGDSKGDSIYTRL